MESEMVYAPQLALASVTAEPLAAVAEEGDGVEANEAVGSTLTMERVAAAKKFIENHYRAQKKNFQERRERYRSDTPLGTNSTCCAPRGLDFGRCLFDRGVPAGLGVVRARAAGALVFELLDMGADFSFLWVLWNAASGSCGIEVQAPC
jgi:hypothetical protein